MTQPMQTCQVCGDVEVCVPGGRGFPPDIAKQRLAKRCVAKGHVCDPKYKVGLALIMPSITCPECGATSHNPNDVREGYCGRCHAWTTPR